MRELARITLSSLTHFAKESTIIDMKHRFMEMLVRPMHRRVAIPGIPFSVQASDDETGGFTDQMPKPIFSLLLHKDVEEHVRHGGALGVTALVLSAPYSVPSWLPQMLMDIAAYEEDLMTSVRDTVHHRLSFFFFWNTNPATFQMAIWGVIICIIITIVNHQIDWLIMMASMLQHTN